ncbi:hypothetical protein E3Q19_03543 [Wallemia mellicola]|uniref:EamA domain-containing protein n=1 Tax=Wallemia mellicola TaxID=1708541 RepID=A0AB38MT02_9BASI|nr:hypothetical protein E3Q19_03543 [Wallemia mellicola]TIC21280.1 hypothetical protein E3Q12_03582 [Wallemia mellicola]TIC40714.1 hypothetical protein E3Q08_03650 [Wallemia mellicola]TIC62142.1 hypothetical protein E3Q02_03648 [Wallemia mellicola]
MNKLGGIAGILIFVSSLIAYAAETELAQVVQSRLGYSKPYFMLWLAHSSFSFCLPLHLLLLKLTSSVPSRLYLRGLALATRNELTPDAPQPSIGAGFWDILPLKTSLVRMFLLTGLATFAAICWWVSVKYTTVADLTAIWNSSAFWAYVFAVYILGEKLQKSKLGAVLLACSGVVLIAYGGERSSRDDPLEDGEVRPKFSAVLLGDLLVFIGSVTFALFEVCLKKYASISENDDEKDVLDDQSDAFSFGSIESDDDVESQKKANSRENFHDNEESDELYNKNIHEHEDEMNDTHNAQRPGSITHSNSASPLINNADSGNVHRMQFERTESSASISTLAIHPPFGLYPNLVSTTIGLITFFTLWLPIPILHWIGWEKFELPPSAVAYGYITAMIAFGMIFNGAFIALCFIWGPVMASVGSLLTIVLVQIVDVLVNHVPLTLFSVLGGSLIILGFVLLVIT